MSARLHDYHAFHFAASRDYDVERVAGLLPPALRGEIYLHLHEGLLRQVPIFHRADKRFIQALAKALRPQVLLAGDYAFNACELGDAAFFIDKGVVQLVSAEGSLADTLSPGGYFGEASHSVSPLIKPAISFLKAATLARPLYSAPSGAPARRAPRATVCSSRCRLAPSRRHWASTLSSAPWSSGRSRRGATTPPPAAGTRRC